MPIGYLSLILHAHLPFVRHPEYPDFLEEDWLYEAISETYIPMLSACKRLLAEGVKFRLTMSMTPPLCEMLADPLLQERYLQHINKLCELAEKEVERTNRYESNFYSAALMYRSHFNECRELFENTYQRQLLRGFRE
ncbi:MAG: DUF1957 domain-containing protein, partial [Blastocatellia bacterium]|nr:DUF1957 domain-containing protein [Blastocatellia bacterium]